MIVVDDRWTGQHGIGRYASELLPRITTPLTSIHHSGSPSSPTDFLFKKVSVNAVTPRAVYSPGYNGFLRNVPQTITLHDLIHLQVAGSSKYLAYYNLFLKPLIKRNRHVLTNSETSRRAIERWVNDARVDVINAGVGRSLAFTRDGPTHEAVRCYFLYVGNLRPHKNVSTIMKAMRMTPDADLALVTSDREAVKNLAEKHGVADRVFAISNVADLELAALYRGARAILQPSLLEGFGLPALESALCGTPVIFFQGCESVSEICAGGGNAVTNATNAGEWSDVMRSITEGQTYPPGVIAPGEYSWDRVGATVSQTLEQYH